MMRVKLLSIYALFVVSLISCGSKIEHIQQPEADTNFLAGLEEMKMQDFDSILHQGLFNAISVPFYTKEGVLIPVSEKMKIISSGEYNTRIYVDSTNKVKLWVVWKLTAEERKKSSDTTRVKLRNDLMGQVAHPFTVEDVNEETFSLKKGKIYVLNFWFLDCYPCIHEIPDLNKLVDKYDEVIFLAFALDKKDELKKFLNKREFKYHVIPDGRELADKYKINVFPTHIIIDKQLKIQYCAVGSMSGDGLNVLETEIKRLTGR